MSTETTPQPTDPGQPRVEPTQPEAEPDPDNEPTTTRPDPRH